MGSIRLNKVSKTFGEMKVIPGPEAYVIMLVVGVLDAWLLYRFFATLPPEEPVVPVPVPTDGA